MEQEVTLSQNFLDRALGVSECFGMGQRRYESALYNGDVNKVGEHLANATSGEGGISFGGDLSAEKMLKALDPSSGLDEIENLISKLRSIENDDADKRPKAKRLADLLENGDYHNAEKAIEQVARAEELAEVHKMYKEEIGTALQL